MLEYAVMVAAVASALIVMTDYVRNAFRAHANAIEEELNGATEENKP
jgi:Flp pilus assembly pilin Flp